MLKAFYICPILLRMGDRPAGTRDCRRGECHLARERARQDLADVGLVTGDDGAIRQGDADRRNILAGLRRTDKGSSKAEHIRPLSRIFGASNFSIGDVTDGVSTVA